MDNHAKPRGRAAAWAPGSRLYRQSDALSDLLRASVAQHGDWFELPLRTLTNGTAALELSSAAEVETVLEGARQALRCATRGFSAYLGVPALAQAITDTYFGAPPKRMWIGPALKLALAALWENVAGRTEGPSRSGSDLVRLAKLAFLVEQLTNVRTLFRTAGDGQVRIAADGLTASGAVDELRQQLAWAYGARGRTLRLAPHTTQLFLHKPAEGLQGLHRVLSGEAPAHVAELAGTLFARLPGPEAYLFWAGLWSHVVFLLASIGHSRVVTERSSSISVMSKTGFAVPRNIEHPHLLAQALLDRQWEVGWYRRQDPDIYPSLVNRRPVIGILSDQSLSVTSPALLMDALNHFVETSFMPEQPSTGAPLPESAFEQLVAFQFEQRVVELFREVGFRAGAVTRAGVWRTAEGDEDLSTCAGLPPGQIDVLAVHRESGCVLVVECKVLSLPTTAGRLRNLVGKVSEEDGEGFWSKLESKCRWMRQVGARLTPEWSGLEGLLVLDAKAPGLGVVRGMRSVHFDGLEQVIRKLARTLWGHP